jgi:LacI family transcriptional regulator
LVSGATHLIGLVVPDVTNPYFSAVVRGIETVARDEGYQVMLCNTDEKPEVEELLLRGLLDRSVDGLIVAPAKETSEMPPVYEDAGVPLVFIDRILGVGNFDSVMVDNIGGSKLAVEHLVAAGHHRIALIGGPLDTSPGRERHVGFVDAMEDRGLPVQDDYVVISDFRERGGYQAALTLAAIQPPPTAVVVGNNLMSIGALKAFHDVGLALPDDLSMIGFDDFALSELITPPLTVVSRPMEEQGVLAMRLLADRLSRRPHRLAQHLVMDVHLVIRGSVKPAKDARPVGVPPVAARR